MFGKIFRQIYTSSLAEKRDTRCVLMDMVVLADSDGVVDITHEALARITNTPLEVVRSAITELESPDPKSRTADHEGRRIVRLDDHRDWGWFIVNYQKFRLIASDEQRREKTRSRVRKFRECNAPVTPCNARNAREKEKEKDSTDINADLQSAERIYKAYPRRVGKPSAIRAILKSLSSITADELLARTEAYAKVRAGDDPNFTPHPATWFNQQRYNDDPATWAKQQQSSPKTLRDTCKPV